MRILMVSMPSLHFFRWTEQLEGSGHEVYWFDITGGAEQSERISWVYQIIGWKLKWDFPGRHFIKKWLPKVYSFIKIFNEKPTATIFEQKLLEIKPDVVHSFALYVACTPIVDVMKKHADIKWIYSSWGSDLYYFQRKTNYLIDIKRVLPRVNYLFTDCKRDYNLAIKYGFKGFFLGFFPGGGGFDLEQLSKFILPIENRNTIIIKGYQGRSGRAIEILKALELIQSALKPYKIVVFGADEEVLNYSRQAKLINWVNFSIIGKVSQAEVLKLMGESLIYIGNSNSDGIPNTLLEAICMGAFPIQSNPGGATEELIVNNKNGLLIGNIEDVTVIKKILLEGIINQELIKSAFEINQIKLKPQFDREVIKNNVLQAYMNIYN